jgi:hypothetical protein
MHNPHYDDMFFTPKYMMGLHPSMWWDYRMISEVLWNHKCQPQSRKLQSWPRFNRNCWKETKESIIELQINLDSMQ